MSDPRPTVGAITESVYAALPEVYRDADAAQDDGPSNYPLLRYLSLILDQLEPIAELITRLTYIAQDERGDQPDAGRMGVPEPWQRFGDGVFGDGTFGDADTSDLVDPTTADAGWLPWLAQLLGVSIVGLDVVDARAALAQPEESWAHGTPAAIIREARRQIDAGAYVDVRAHYGGDPFTIAVVTKRTETYGTTTWGELEAATRGVWSGINALGSWNAAEAAAVMGVAVAERPAGFRLVHAYLEDLGA